MLVFKMKCLIFACIDLLLLVSYWFKGSSIGSWGLLDGSNLACSLMSTGTDEVWRMTSSLKVEVVVVMMKSMWWLWWCANVRNLSESSYIGIIFILICSMFIGFGAHSLLPVWIPFMYPLSKKTSSFMYRRLAVFRRKPIRFVGFLLYTGTFCPYVIKKTYWVWYTSFSHYLFGQTTLCFICLYLMRVWTWIIQILSH